MNRFKTAFAWLATLLLAAPSLLAETEEAGEHAAEHAGEMVHGEAHRTLMDPMVSEMVWAIVVFVIFASVLSILVWPRILKAMKAREEKIAGDLHRTEEAAHKAEATLKEYQAKLQEARAEAQRIVDAARIEAERAASRIAADATAEIDAQKKRATAEIQFAKETALREIFGQAASLATDVAGKILKREIQPADNDRLVRDSLAALQAKNLQ